jgi:hypothetical protein
MLQVSVAGWAAAIGRFVGWNLRRGYYAGSVMEKNLSVDNALVFVVIMSTAGRLSGRYSLVSMVMASSRRHDQRHERTN